MPHGSPQITLLALLVRKYGERLPNGGYEMRLSAAEMTSMSSHDIFQESPDPVGRGMRWQYFPVKILDIEGRTVPDAPKKTDAIEKKDAEQS